jgi:hypothetical protein
MTNVSTRLTSAWLRTALGCAVVGFALCVLAPASVHAGPPEKNGNAARFGNGPKNSASRAGQERSAQKKHNARGGEPEKRTKGSRRVEEQRQGSGGKNGGSKVRELRPPKGSGAHVPQERNGAPPPKHNGPRSSAAEAARSQMRDDAASGEVVQEGDTRVKVMTFSGLDIEGRLKSPQLLYFENRMRAEFDRPRLPHRTFMPELERSAKREPE